MTCSIAIIELSNSSIQLEVNQRLAGRERGRGGGVGVISFSTSNLRAQTMLNRSHEIKQSRFLTTANPEKTPIEITYC